MVILYLIIFLSCLFYLYFIANARLSFTIISKQHILAKIKEINKRPKMNKPKKQKQTK